MNTGYITVQVTTGEDALPVDYAHVIICRANGTILYDTYTDENGNTGYFSLPAPNVQLTLDPNYNQSAYSVYDIDVEAEGFVSSHIRDVEIVDTQTAILPVVLDPLAEEPHPVTETDITIPPVALLSNEPKQHSAGMEVMSPQPPHAIPVMAAERGARATQTAPVTSFREVVIPDYITVHLGVPSNTSARNVRVKFSDYVKNVASSEIYSTWPENALLANIHAIVSFALNRVYTEWYRSRNFAFDITNSTAYDQAYREGGPVYESISRLVNEVFNTYARRIGFNNPFFTQFCNGTTVTCAGMSQWGTVPLANQGKTPLQIMHNYYPNDLELVQSDNIRGIVESFPGQSLRLGSQSEDVRRMQNYLNRIRVNFPLIPRISNPNGYFGVDTQEAVRIFQRTFKLTSDGIIGRATWNKINFLYVGVIRLAELDSEGERIGLSPNPPQKVISMGAKGEDVKHLQFLLNFISAFYESVPPVIKDSSFDSVTKNSVIEFQRTFNLTPDGVVGPQTWNKLYAVYNGIEDNVKIPPGEIAPLPTLPPYPGQLLRMGSSGPDVLIMQNYLNTIRIVYQNIPYLQADGVFGQRTRNSVVAFQQEFLLSPDGIIGPVTWDEIVKQFNIVSGRI